MMLTIQLASRTIAIRHHFPYIAQLCRDYQVADTPPDFTVAPTQEEITQEYEENDGAFSLPHCEAVCVHRHISLNLLAYNTFIMHAAVVEVDHSAYAFLAHSGVGKSTHMNLWLQHFGPRASVLNGDKPMIAYENGQFYAYGTPWQGKENLGKNSCAPLKGLALLERSDQNSIRLANSHEIVHRLFDQVLVPKTPVELSKMMELLNKLIQTVPIYMLGCNMSPQAAEVASQRMCEELL